MFNLNFGVNRQNPRSRDLNQTETFTDYAATLAHTKGIHNENSSG
jgi:hypothetical protein